MLDYVNEDLIRKGDEPISFDHDCREGICGTCGVMIDGQAHGPQKGTATCRMRKFNDGDEITIEPWRRRVPHHQGPSVVNWAALDRIEAGGYITVNKPHPTPTRSRPKEASDSPWTPRRASAARVAAV